MPYEPEPIDNSAVELSPDLKSLTETLARNNHDLWAKARMAEGWRYGPGRDEPKLETPLLVPYEELAESEKDYDRQNAAETLKSIIRFGGKVEAPQYIPVAWIPNRDSPWTYEQYRDLGNQANGRSESLIAVDIADEALGFWNGDSALVQIKALALARMGSQEQAHALLSTLPAYGDDEEAAGILARTVKDIWLRTGKTEDLRSARDSYLAACGNHPERYWSRINAATLSWALGDTRRAVQLAGETLQTCVRQTAAAAAGEKYWLAATIAEAALVTAASRDPEGIGADWNEVERCYADARGMAAENFGHLFGTWRNAQIILSRMPAGVAERIGKAFRVPRVAVFAGHRIDSVGRGTPRFPAENATRVKASIREQLIRLNVGIGFSSAASGSDILFLETLRELGGKTHIVLPCGQDQFIEQSVASAGTEWVEQFKAAISAAEEVVIAADQPLPGTAIILQYASDLRDGLAVIRARQYEIELLHLALWDGLPGDGRGGTRDSVVRWQARGHKVHVIRPPDVAKSPNEPRWIAESPSCALSPEAEPGSAGSTVAPEIRAIIFADVRHFGQLGERQIPGFLRDFLGPVAAFARRTVPQPLFQNTWGDGFFFVFAKPGDAARFAVRLRDCAAGIDCEAAGLPAGMSLRIALHAGPVIRFYDQFIGKFNYTGYHVNYAARIEPVTPPGRVYATEAFAALTTLEAPGHFRFDYVGRIPLPKSFGRFAMYDLDEI